MMRVALLALLIPLSAACALVRPDSCGGLRHYKQFDWAPVGHDEKTRDPATLPRDVQIAVDRFLSDAWPVVAAREERSYYLLEVQNPGELDANRFLIYSKRLHCIVGYFGWHGQG